MLKRFQNEDLLSQISASRDQIKTRISVLVSRLRALECKLLDELSALESECKDNLTETDDLIILQKLQRDVDTVPSKKIILVWEDKMENLLLSQFCKIVVIEKSAPLESVTNSLTSLDNLVTNLQLNIDSDKSPDHHDTPSLHSPHDDPFLSREPTPDDIGPRYLSPQYSAPPANTATINHTERAYPDAYSSIDLPIHSACPYGSGRSQLQGARGIAIREAAKQIYVADRGNNRVQVFSDTGRFLFGFTHTEMEGPKGICIRENLGLLFLTLCERNAVHCYSLDGYLVRKIGCMGTALSQFIQPSGIAADSACKIYVCDFGNNRIQVFTKDLRYITILTHKVSKPTDIKVCDDFVYILDHGKLCVSVFNRGGAFMGEIVPCGPEVYEVKHPYFFDIDFKGNFLITDIVSNCIKVFSSRGYYICQVGSSGEEEGQFIQPTGVALVDSCVVTVCERMQNQLQIFKMF